MKKMSFIVAAATIWAWGAPLWPGLAWAKEVGHFAQVVNNVNYLKQGKGPALQAKVKDGVENQDMVRTAEKSRAMMRFIDDTSMTVGPKSELIIEDYMYDANKGKRNAVVQVFKGVVETVTPRVIPSDQPAFIMKTPTATAGIRGTRYVTVVVRNAEGGSDTIFYVLSGKIRVSPTSPYKDPGSAAMKCIAKGLQNRLPIKDILEQCLAAGLDACALIKAAVFQGVNPEELATACMDLGLTTPQLREVLTQPFLVRCIVEALRAMKEADVSAGMYAVLKENLAPIVGEFDLECLTKIASLLEEGITLENLCGYPPTAEQIAAAELPGIFEYIPPELPPVVVVIPPDDVGGGGGTGRDGSNFR